MCNLRYATIGTRSNTGRLRRVLRLAAAACSLLVTTACDVEWGGARLVMEDPAPAPEPVVSSVAAETPAAPLPVGPLLYMVRLQPQGMARVVPAAGLPRQGGSPLPLEIPSPPDDAYRARFDSTFLRPGTELAIQRWGRRIGTVILQSTQAPMNSACLSVGTGTALLIPGTDVAGVAAAVPLDLSPALPAVVSDRAPVRGMVLAAPVLAERLIGGNRAYLAQRVSLQSILLPEDSVPAMAATYLVNDSLAPGGPSGDAISLLFVATYEASRGYTPMWREVRRYRSEADKEAFQYLDWMRLPGGYLHLLRRFDGSGVGLAGSFVPQQEGGDGVTGVEWRESGPCRSLDLLSASSR